MDLTERPWRSVLYIPGLNRRALDKARGLPVDAVIFDLEDAVAPAEKAAARAVLAEELTQGGYGTRARLVRVNGLDTDWGKADLAAFATADCDGILIPKVSSAADLDAVAALVPELPLWAMIETCRGVLNAAEIAAHPRLAGFVMGTNDLAKELGARSRAAMSASLQRCLLAARSEGVVCLDGVYNAFKDDDGLRAECEDGRDLGMDGKTLIHPAQVAITNEVFAPSEDEVALAKRQIDAFREATAEGKGVAVVDGRIVENLHIVTAKAVLAKADAITAMEA